MTDKQKLFLDHLFGDAKGDIRLAMELAGYSSSTSSKEVTDSLSKEIEDRTRQFIALNGPKAVFTMLGVLTGEEILGVKEKIAASKDFLDRAGFGKVEKIEVDAKSPLFLLPAKQKDETED